MTAWPKKSLGEVARFINGYPFKPSDWSANGLPIIRIQNLTNPTAPANRYNGTFDKRYAVQDGDLLVSWSATLDVFIWNGGNAILNQHIFLVAPDLTQVSKTYLFYALKSVMDELRAQTHGATMKHITKGPFERTQIPVPPLAEQERVVKLLDEADELRKLRIRADQHTATLIPALFHEMFGETTTNSKGFHVERLEKCIGLLGGFAFKSQDFCDDGIPVIRIGTANKGQFDLNNLVFLPLRFANTHPQFLVKPDDVVITLTGTVGKDDYANICFVSPKYENWFLNQRVAKVEFVTDKIMKEYLFWAFRQPMFKAKLIQCNRGVRQANISNGDILGLKMPLPPLSLQKEFAHRVAEIRELETAQSQSRKRLDALFQSLLHRAFIGEL